MEWENARLSEARRSKAMLMELRFQIAELMNERGTESDSTIAVPPFELLVVFDQGQFHSEHLGRMLQDSLGESDAVLNWRLVPSAGGGYYRSKDIGAKQAAGEILLFLDSDVVPESGWLEQILSSLDDPGVQIVAGSTYIEPFDIVSKVFALTWFFPLRMKDGPLKLVESFFANNLAMRRSLYDQYPFPDLSGTSRGGCIVLSSQLAEAEVPVYQNPNARVGHPAPNGVKHFVWRALAQGRDDLLRERTFGTSWSASLVGSGARLLRHWARSVWSICTRFYRVNLNPLMVPVAVTISWTYYFLYFLGETMTHLGIHSIHKVRV